MSIKSAVRKIAPQIGPAKGLRILHVTDIHNRLGGLLLCRWLARALQPAVVVDTGDLSGLGSMVETALIRAFARPGSPLVFVPGNHDSAAAARQFRGAGACVLDTPGVCEAGGVRIFGYPDPNRTKLMRGRDYRVAACGQAAGQIRVPHDEAPLVGAVHNEKMLESTASIPLILSGHYHRPKIARTGPSLRVCTGSTGGGGPFGGALHATVVEIEPDTYLPIGLWLLEVSRGIGTAEEVDLAAIS